MNHFLQIIIIILFTTVFSFADNPEPAKKDLGKQEAIQDILDKMSLEQKVSQMFFGFLNGYFINDSNPAHLKNIDLVKKFQIGGFIVYRSTPFSQRYITQELQKYSDIPLMFSQDLEWGAGMRIDHATTFPSMMALGATRDPKLVYAMGRVIAREVRAMGIHQAYAPVADINNNPENPIINVRSFGESPELVSEMAQAYVRGLQDGGVLATAKHFPGHGDTSVDSHKGLPKLEIDEKRLFAVELHPFQALIKGGVASIMTGHLALPALDSEEGIPASLSPYLITEILRKKMGFQGLIVTDGMNMSGVTEGFGVHEASVRAVRAGNDILLMSPDPYAARSAIIRAVTQGSISVALIDQAVLRILRAKQKLGLFKRKTEGDRAVTREVALPEHEALARLIARKSVTLLSNRNGMIPLLKKPEKAVCVVFSDTDNPDIAKPFIGALKKRIPLSNLETFLVDQRTQASELDRIMESVVNSDCVLVPCYYKVRAWSGNISLSSEHAVFLKNLIDAPSPEIIVSFGNPYILKEMQNPQVYINCYSGGDYSQLAVVEAIFGESPVSGKLPVSIPGSYSYGTGLNLDQQCLRAGRPEDVGLAPDLGNQIESRIQKAIEDRVFPSASVAVGRHGILVLNKGYGYLTYDSEKKVTRNSRFDLASLTKVVATTVSVMKLMELGKLKLSDRVSKFLPAFGNGGKEDVTVEHLLYHTSGFKPYIGFLEQGATGRDDVQAEIFTQVIDRKPGEKVVYSDLGMITLGWVVEAVSGQTLDSFARENSWNPLGMNHTGFLLGAREYPNSVFVPTEIDHVHRNGLVQGVVHDGTAFVLGGIAGHAGVFSTSSDLAQFAYMMLNGGKANGISILKPETIDLFIKRKTFSDHKSRALGWDVKSLEGYASSGALAGPKTFGHLGFTGTSIWMDPEQELFVILLTNRVYPSRSERRHRQLRSEIGDIVFGAITGPPELDLESLGK